MCGGTPEHYTHQCLSPAEGREVERAVVRPNGIHGSMPTYHQLLTSLVAGSEPLLALAWKRASWVQETCLLIQAAVLRTASRLFHRGLRVCFKEDYEHLFDVPQHSRTDNDVSGLSPIYIPAAGG